ncbi:unnamed protein product [Victoria cruziana]
METEYQVKTETGYSGAGPRYVRPVQVFLRLISFFATLVATIVMALSKETSIIPFVLSPVLPPIQISAPAKYHYSSAFVYFVVVNAIACGYAAVSMALWCSKKAARSKGFTAALCAVDVIMLALVSTGTGAAAAIGLVGKKGNSHLNWNKICNHFGRFCSQVAAAIGVSIVGILAFLLLALLSIAGLRRRSR